MKTLGVQFVIKRVIDNETVEILNPGKVHFENLSIDFKVVPNIDQSQVFDKSWEVLAEGKCIGIFPEGASNDKADLLPLKPGACIMSLGANIKHNVKTKIITCGMNYYEVRKSAFGSGSAIF